MQAMATSIDRLVSTDPADATDGAGAVEKFLAGDTAPAKEPEMDARTTAGFNLHAPGEVLRLAEPTHISAATLSRLEQMAAWAVVPALVVAVLGFAAVAQFLPPLSPGQDAESIAATYS